MFFKSQNCIISTVFSLKQWWFLVNMGKKGPNFRFWLKKSKCIFKCIISGVKLPNYTYTLIHFILQSPHQSSKVIIFLWIDFIHEIWMRHTYWPKVFVFTDFLDRFYKNKRVINKNMHFHSSKTLYAYL